MPLKQFLAIVAILFGFIQGSQAQIFHVQGGSSSLMDAHGGSVDFQAPGYSGSLGFGLVNGNPEFGAVLRTEFRGFKLTAGDDTLPFNLPTDIFNGSHFFYGRGLGIAGGTERFKFQAFGGATSSSIGAAYFSAARADEPFGLFFTQFQLNKSFSLVTRSVFSEKSTIITGLEWSPSKALAIAASGGIGANAPYFANSLNIEREKLTFRGSYIFADTAFQRIGARVPLLSEADRENLLFSARPTRNFSFSVSRQNVLSPLTSTQPSERALVHQLGANTSLFNFRLNGSLYQSRVFGKDTVGYALSASRAITRKIDAGVDFYRSTSEHQLPNQSLVARVREALTQRVSLTQYFGRSNGQMSFHLGGEYTSNRLSVAVSHETAYAPFRPDTAGGPFVHVYNVSLRFRLFGNFEVTGHTNVTPEGKIKYTASAGDYFYRYSGLEGAGRPSLKISDWVVKGKVVDDQGVPVAGAALQIDGQMAFSDSNGEFLVRLLKRERVSVKVLLDDFLIAVPYEVVNAPNSVESASEEKATPVTVVLKRITDISRLNSPK